MNRITQEAKKRQAVVKSAERKAKVLLRGIRSKLIKCQKVVQAARREMAIAERAFLPTGYPVLHTANSH